MGTQLIKSITSDYLEFPSLPSSSLQCNHLYLFNNAQGIPSKKIKNDQGKIVEIESNRTKLLKPLCSRYHVITTYKQNSHFSGEAFSLNWTLKFWVYKIDACLTAICHGYHQINCWNHCTPHIAWQFWDQGSYECFLNPRECWWPPYCYNPAVPKFGRLHSHLRLVGRYPMLQLVVLLLKFL